MSCFSFHHFSVSSFFWWMGRLLKISWRCVQVALWLYIAIRGWVWKFHVIVMSWKIKSFCVAVSIRANHSTHGQRVYVSLPCPVISGFFAECTRWLRQDEHTDSAPLEHRKSTWPSIRVWRRYFNHHVFKEYFEIHLDDFSTFLMCEISLFSLTSLQNPSSVSAKPFSPPPTEGNIAWIIVVGEPLHN